MISKITYRAKRFLVNAICMVILLLIAVQGYSQAAEDQMVINTKKGSLFKGKIVGETESIIEFVLSNTNDTISIEKNSVRFKSVEKGKIILSKGKYHKSTGWVNSLGLLWGPNSHFSPYYVAGFTSQLEYTGYKMIRPRLGIGGGGGLMVHGGLIFGYEDVKNLKFFDLYSYAKLYMSDTKVRPYLDAKLGYGFPLESIDWYCYGCEEPTMYNTIYRSGVIFQLGLGVEFASTKERRSGLKFSVYAHGTRDVRHTPGAVFGIVLGYNLFF